MIWSILISRLSAMLCTVYILILKRSIIISCGIDPPQNARYRSGLQTAFPHLVHFSLCGPSELLTALKLRLPQSLHLSSSPSPDVVLTLLSLRCRSAASCSSPPLSPLETISLDNWLTTLFCLLSGLRMLGSRRPGVRASRMAICPKFDLTL